MKSNTAVLRRELIFILPLTLVTQSAVLLYVRREIISFRAVFSLQSDEILTGLCCINEGLISRCLTVGSALLRYPTGGLVIAAVNCYNSTEKGSQIFRTAGSLSVRGETINKNKTKRIRR